MANMTVVLTARLPWWWLAVGMRFGFDADTDEAVKRIVRHTKIVAK